MLRKPILVKTRYSILKGKLKPKKERPNPVSTLKTEMIDLILTLYTTNWNYIETFFQEHSVCVQK